MDPITQQAVLATAGAGGSDPLYVDDVFSTFLYDGTFSGHTVTNGLDLGGEGGLVWLKNRTGYASHALMSSDSNFVGWLGTDNNNPRAGTVAYVTGNSDGFTLNNGGLFFNSNGQDYTSWSFRKAPGFFDVVTWTGNSVSGRQIAHNLGSVPGFIMIKSYVAGTGGTGWMCYHRSLGNTKAIRLDNGTAATSASSAYWNNTDPTSTHFTVGNQEDINTLANSRSYVAYVFAHDEPVFGTNEDESIIKCGTYTGNGSPNGPTINLGFEPQWLMTKRSSSTGNWTIYDAMRGAGAPNQTILEANNTALEDNNAVYNVDFNPTGFQLKTSNATFNGIGETFIYVAIRRPNKPPSAATDVFKPVAASNGDPVTATGFVTDYCLWRSRGSSVYNAASSSRLTGTSTLFTSSNAAESNYIGLSAWQTNDGMNHRGVWAATVPTVSYFFKRAPGFFDVVTYTGNNTVRTISHNLEVAPELMFVKNRSFGWQWCGYSTASGAGKSIKLSSNVAAFAPGFWNNTAPTSSVFTISAADDINENNSYYVAYLFATLPGISKIGTYSGTDNTNVTVDCGFSSGPRFIMIKRTDSAGSWAVMDSARGINSGTNSYDPTLYLDLTTAEAAYADYIDPTSSGFTVKSSATAGGFNNTGGTFLFLAIA